MLEMDDIQAGYGRTLVLHGVTLPSAQTVVVLGHNGAGKSTLLRVAIGLIKPRSGKVIFDDADITALAPNKRIARGMAYVPQGQQSFTQLTTMENLQLVADGRKRGKALIEQQLARIVHRDHADGGAAVFRQHLPGDDVGVVFHGAEQDLVALMHIGAAEGLGHEVDGLRGAPGPDDLLGGGGIEERPHLFPGLFKTVRGFLTQGGHAAMHIGVLQALVVVHTVDHRLGHLPADGAVQVNHGLAVERGCQQRKVLADRGDIEWGGRGHGLA